MSIKNFSKFVAFFLLLFVAGQFLEIRPALATNANVNALGKVTIEAAEEDGLVKAVGQIGGKVIGRVAGVAGVVLELVWPDRAGGTAFPVLTIGNTSVNEGETKNVSSSTGNYTVVWNVLEQPNVKCYAFDQAMSLNPSISFFELLPTVGQMSYVPNTRWLGSRSGQGGEIAYTNQSGDHWYSMVCYEKQDGGWLTQAIDAITIFGTVTQQAYFTKQETLHMSVGSTPAPAPAPVVPPPPAPPVVAFLANPGVINQGQSAILSWASDNATSCTGTNFSTGGQTNATTLVSPASTTTYSVSCTGPGGTSSKNTQVNVIPAAAAPPPASGPGCSPQIDIKVQ